MKLQLLAILVLLSSFAYADELLDSVVFKGDTTHNISGMSHSASPELYGFFGNETSTMMVWQPGCGESTRPAEFTLNAPRSAEYMWVRFPDSFSDDSFKVEASFNGTWVYIGEFIDPGYTQTIITSIFYMPNVTEWKNDVRFRITATGVADICTDGQLGVMSSAFFSTTLNYGNGNGGGNGGGPSTPPGNSTNTSQDHPEHNFHEEGYVPEFGTIAAFMAAVISLAIFAMGRN